MAKKKISKFTREVKAKMKIELKKKKENLFVLDNLVFLPSELAYGLREKLRQEIINMEKELGI